MSNISHLTLPKFAQSTVTEYLRDGYWLEAPDVTGTGTPDLVGYGLKVGEIYWYENPSWEKRLVIDKIKEPVGMDFGNITGVGGDDLAVCYQLYGPGGTIHHADPEGGKIDWLQNPGPEGLKAGERWKRRYVGRATGMHRLRIGHFTRTDRLQIMGFPIVAVESVHSVLPVVLFTSPEDPETDQEWQKETISDSDFRMIHGVAKKPGVIPGSSLDSILMASDEGVTWLYWNEATQQWAWEHIGEGELGQFAQTTFKGSGDLDGGRIGDDPLAYVAAIEPFHGNKVAVYVRNKETPGWTRFLLDTYGDPNENGEGPGHSVMCRDFDGDGDDEFLIGLRGPDPWQGVIYYKAIDLQRGLFLKWKVAEESTARIVSADFDGTGTPDFATISYSVEHYFVAPKAKITLHPNLTREG
ncbi:VCBS repeat-containing protein [Psychromicrobium sp. YIM B11713]|uniref:VCBS repeat-containing protein n=1 Tax=Psychromicrobium sp. YIM B11713 TaxID=3145233 RepID=UPI00374F2559